MAHEGDPVVSGDGVGERLVFTLLCPVEFLVHVYVGTRRAHLLWQAQAKGLIMQAQSHREAKQTHWCLKQASWLLPGRLYPAESWVGSGYIGDGPG